LTLRQFEGRAAREVAGLLGSTEQAVHALYRRALAAWADAADVRAQEP
jgi:DNA-directed RNA polymerase specialized sigma24 family protein